MGVPDYFDALQIARPDPGVFRQFQGAVAAFERRRAAVGHRVEAHHRHADGVGIHADWSRHQHARRGRLQILARPTGPSPPVMVLMPSTIARWMGRAEIRSTTVRGTR